MHINIAKRSFVSLLVDGWVFYKLLVQFLLHVVVHKLISCNFKFVHELLIYAIKDCQNSMKENKLRKYIKDQEYDTKLNRCFIWALVRRIHRTCCPSQSKVQSQRRHAKWRFQEVCSEYITLEICVWNAIRNMFICLKWVRITFFCCILIKGWLINSGWGFCTGWQWCKFTWIVYMRFTVLKTGCLWSPVFLKSVEILRIPCALSAS